MLTTDRERATCAKYGARDETGHVHCMECPLVVDALTCKATEHYDRHLREWVMDEEEECQWKMTERLMVVST